MNIEQERCKTKTQFSLRKIVALYNKPAIWTALEIRHVLELNVTENHEHNYKI